VGESTLTFVGNASARVYFKTNRRRSRIFQTRSHQSVNDTYAWA